MMDFFETNIVRVDVCFVLRLCGGATYRYQLQLIKEFDNNDIHGDRRETSRRG